MTLRRAGRTCTLFGRRFQQWNVEACFAISVRFKGEEGVENETYVLRFASFCELLRQPLNNANVRPLV